MLEMPDHLVHRFFDLPSHRHRLLRISPFFEHKKTHKVRNNPLLLPIVSALQSLCVPISTRGCLRMPLLIPERLSRVKSNQHLSTKAAFPLAPYLYFTLPPDVPPGYR